jgi:hypothetical protein
MSSEKKDAHHRVGHGAEIFSVDNDFSIYREELLSNR